MDCAAHAKKTKEIFQTLTAENLIPTLDGSQAYTEREKELLLEAGVPEEILDKIQSFSAKKATEETDKATYQAMEALLHNLNTMHSRAGAQTPFSSINYGMDTSTEGRMVMKNMLLVTEAGLGNGETAIFPIQIFRVKDGVNFNPGEPNYDLFKLSCRVSAKRLFPNFSFQDAPFNLQYYKEGHPETEIAYMGCRTRVIGNVNDPEREITYGRGNLSFTSINLPRIAYLSRNEAEFFSRLDHMMDVAARSLKIKRTTIGRLMDEGLYPYTKRYLGSFDNHFSTIGLVGMNEAGLNAAWLRKDLTHEETQDFAVRVLNHMRERLSDYQEQYGDLYNLEATPAESTSYRLAKHDKQRYPDIVTAHEGATPYYTNSSHLPVGYTEDIFAALDVQDKLQTLYTSGTVFHAFLGEKLPSWQSAAALVRKIAENYELPYYTISPTYSVCADHGYLAGEHFTCPVCGKKAEVYSRITGYYRPVQNWNDGKSQEYKDRRTYQVGGGAQSAAATCPVETPAQPASACTADAPCTLFVTATCPNCRVVKPLLQRAGIAYEERDVAQHQEEAAALGLTQAPTLLVHSDPPVLYAGVARIREFLKNTAQ